MKKFGWLLLLLLCGSWAAAQTSSLTATITDSDGQTWNNGTYKIEFVGVQGSSTYTWNGATLTTAQMSYSGTLNGSGVITANIPDNNYISPFGTQWKVTICPNASGGCVSFNSAVTGATPDYSTAWSAKTSPIRINPTFGAHAYSDTEVVTPNNSGSTYYNVTTAYMRVWTGSAWVNLASAGGTLTGSGTAGYVAAFTGTTSLGNSSMRDNLTLPVSSPHGLGVGILGYLTYDMPNEATTGTTLNTMSCQTALAYTTNICPHTSTSGGLGPAVTTLTGAPGKTGNASICNVGNCPVLFDNQTTAGHIAIFSTTTDGYLHDTGATTTVGGGVDNFLISSANSGAGTVANIKVGTPDTTSIYNAAKVTATAPIVATLVSGGVNLSLNIDSTLRVNSNNLGVSGAIDTRTSCITDLAPVVGDDGLVTLLNPATAVHITRFSGGVTGSTSVIANLVKGGASLIADATLTAGDANQVVVTTFANGSGQCGGTSSCAVAAHAPVTLHIGTISGTPTGVTACVDYTVD